MSRAVFFWVATLLLMLAAPRAAGAGVEVSGLGGLFVIGGEVESVSGSGSAKVPGPLFEVRTFATGLEEGAAMEFAMNVGIRLAR